MKQLQKIIWRTSRAIDSVTENVETVYRLMRVSAWQFKRAFGIDPRAMTLRIWGAIGLVMMLACDYEHTNETLGNIIMVHGVLAMAASMPTWTTRICSHT